MEFFLRQTFKLKSFSTILVLAILFVFSGCNSKLADLSPIRYAPFHLETTNLSGTFTRLIIFMTKTDGSESFAKFYTAAPVIDMEVPIGNYNFYGISYSNFSVERCSIVTNKSVSGLQNQVTLDFQETTCADEVFIGPSSTLNTGTPAAPAFSPSRMEFCESLDGITSSTDRCTDDLTDTSRKQARGHVSSYRWIIKGFNKSRGNLTFSGDEWASTCTDGTPTTGSLRGLSSTFLGFSIPAGDGSLTPFHVRLELWPGNTGCSQGEPFNVDLPYGLLSETSHSKYFVDATGPNHKLYLRANGDDICQGLNLTPEFAGGTGNIESPKLICDERQLYKIFPDTTSAALYQSYANFKYKLLSNIDLSDNPVTGAGFSPVWETCVAPGSNFMPIGTTRDAVCGNAVVNSIVFDGGGKKIKGLKINLTTPIVGFYRTIGLGSRIQRLTLENPAIQGDGQTGALVGQSFNSSVRYVNLINPVVTNTANLTGGLLGDIQGGTFENIVIQNATVTGTINVGGFAGRAVVGSVGARLNKIFVDGSVTGSTDTGGIAGIYGTANSLSEASEIRFTGTIRGLNKNVGGLFGSALSARIVSSYANATFHSTFLGSPITLGGLVGEMTNKTAAGPAGIYRSWIKGTIVSHLCTTLDANCSLGSVVGSHDGTFTAADFDTVVYPIIIHSTLTNFPVGVSQTNDSFTSLTPNWTNGSDLMPLFPLSVWEFFNGSEPKLVSEP